MSGPDTASGKRNYAVPALEKALDVIEYMAGQANGLTVTELAGALGRTVHEIYRIVLALETRGYLFKRENSERYHISLKLFDLAHQLPSVRQLSDSALPVMQALAPQAKQSCHLAVLSGHEVLIVLQVESPLPMRYSVMLGAKFDFAETSSGAVLYAYSAPRIRDQLDSRLDSVTAGPPRRHDSSALRLRAEAILARGWEVRKSLAVEGVTNISVPIFDYLGHAVAALTVPYMPQRAATIPLETVRDLVIAASRAISAGLGARQTEKPDAP